MSIVLSLLLFFNTAFVLGEGSLSPRQGFVEGYFLQYEIIWVDAKGEAVNVPAEIWQDPAGTQVEDTPLMRDILERIYKEKKLAGEELSKKVMGDLGYVQQIKTVIEGYGGEIYSLPMIANPQLLIDTRPVQRTDFQPGMEVYAELQGRSIRYMDAFSADLPGYIPPGGKVRVGQIKKIDRDQIQVVLPTGTQETYFTSPATIVLKNKVNVSTNVLYEGDRVKLYFDEIDTPYISRLEVEGNSILIKDLYRGTLMVANGLEDKITLENVDVFRNGSWTSLSTGIRVPYNSDLPLYIGGQKIDYRNLKHYRGKRVYLAMKDFFGQEKVEKMVIQSQYERTFSDRIEDINWYSSQMELANKKNISFHEGTMVIKNGRLVDIDVLTIQSDGFFVADGRGGGLVADVISIYNEGLNNSNIGQEQIYAGRLDKVLRDTVVLRDFFLLDQNEWVSFAEDKEFFYDDDTFVYDLENNQVIPTKEFYSGEYSIDERGTSYTKPRDWYAYAYTDGDRIASIFVKKSSDSLRRQRTTTGVVENNPAENPYMGWAISVRDAKDFSSRHGQWMLRNSSLSLFLKEAMIIKNGKRVEIQEIKAGDRLYLVRDDSMAKIVVVK